MMDADNIPVFYDPVPAALEAAPSTISPDNGNSNAIEDPHRPLLISASLCKKKKQKLDCTINTFQGRLERSSDINNTDVRVACGCDEGSGATPNTSPTMMTGSAAHHSLPKAYATTINTSTTSSRSNRNHLNANGSPGGIPSSKSEIQKDLLASLKEKREAMVAFGKVRGGLLKGRVVLQEMDGSPYSGVTYSSRIESSAFSDPVFFCEEERQEEAETGGKHCDIPQSSCSVFVTSSSTFDAPTSASTRHGGESSVKTPPPDPYSLGVPASSHAENTSSVPTSVSASVTKSFPRQISAMRRRREKTMGKKKFLKAGNAFITGDETDLDKEEEGEHHGEWVEKDSQAEEEEVDGDKDICSTSSSCISSHRHHHGSSSRSSVHSDSSTESLSSIFEEGPAKPSAFRNSSLAALKKVGSAGSGGTGETTGSHRHHNNSNSTNYRRHYRRRSYSSTSPHGSSSDAVYSSHRTSEEDEEEEEEEWEEKDEENGEEKEADQITEGDAPASGQDDGMATDDEEDEKDSTVEEVDPTFLDEFGFVIDEKTKEEEELYVKNIDGIKVLRAEVKWEKLTADWNTQKEKNAAFIKRRCRKGIPSRFRGNVWQVLLQSRQQMGKSENIGVYEALRDKRLAMPHPTSTSSSTFSTPQGGATPLPSPRSEAKGERTHKQEEHGRKKIPTTFSMLARRLSAAIAPTASSFSSSSSLSGTTITDTRQGGEAGFPTPRISDRQSGNKSSMSKDDTASIKKEHEVDAQIRRDLNRTFPNHVLFRQKHGAGQIFLRNVLHACAAAAPEVGYTQGMGFLVCALSTQLREEETFWALHVLMHDPKWALGELYRPGFPMLHQLFYQLEKLMMHVLPRLSRHFKKNNVEPSFYATEWFLRLFVGILPFRSLVRMWDVFFFEGWKMVFRTALTLLKREEPFLLKLSGDKLLLELKKIHERQRKIDADTLISECLKVKFYTKDLNCYKEEFLEKKREEQEGKMRKKALLLNSLT